MWVAIADLTGNSSYFLQVELGPKCLGVELTQHIVSHESIQQIYFLERLKGESRQQLS